MLHVAFIITAVPLIFHLIIFSGIGEAVAVLFRRPLLLLRGRRRPRGWGRGCRARVRQRPLDCLLPVRRGLRVLGARPPVGKLLRGQEVENLDLVRRHAVTDGVPAAVVVVAPRPEQTKLYPRFAFRIVFCFSKEILSLCIAVYE